MNFRAWARQTIGLSRAEFDALTPREMEAELDAALKREKRENEKLERLERLIDIHFALAHTLAHNAHFRRRAQTADYRILQEQKQHFTAEQLAIDAKLRAQAQARVAQKRREQFLKNT